MGDPAASLIDNNQNEDLKADPSESESDVHSGNISNRIGISLFAPIATGILYIIFANYMATYCQTLSLPFGSLDLPSSFYLYAIYELMRPFYMTLILIYILRKTIINKYYTDEFICMASVVTFFMYMGYTNSYGLAFSISFAVFFYGIMKSDEKMPMGTNWEAFLILFILLTASNAIAFSKGTNIIIGGYGSSEIELELKDINISVSNETLILVLYTDDIYYVVEKRTPAPQSPTLYTIPKEQVKSANIKRVTVRNAQFYDDWIERTKEAINMLAR